MSDFHKTLPMTGVMTVGGLVTGQLVLLGIALIVVGMAAFGIRFGWRRNKHLSQA